MTLNREQALQEYAEPRRRAILELVAENELPAGQISSQFSDVSASAVSQHLRILKNVGLLVERRDGARRLYRADTDALEELRSYLNDLWASSLKVAQSITEAEHRGDTDEQREVG